VVGVSQSRRRRHKSEGPFIRRADLPEDLGDAEPALLRQLCEGNNWSTRDLVDHFDTTTRAVERVLDAHDIQPGPKAPWSDGNNTQEQLAAVLWRMDPEDAGLTSTPDDWEHTVSLDDYEEEPTTHTLADFSGGDADE